jgi:hypothetical protein
LGLIEGSSILRQQPSSAFFAGANPAAPCWEAPSPVNVLINAGGVVQVDQGNAALGLLNGIALSAILWAAGLLLFA